MPKAKSKTGRRAEPPVPSLQQAPTEILRATAPTLTEVQLNQIAAMEAVQLRPSLATVPPAQAQIPVPVAAPSTSVPNNTEGMGFIDMKQDGPLGRANSFHEEMGHPDALENPWGIDLRSENIVGGDLKQLQEFEENFHKTGRYGFTINEIVCPDQGRYDEKIHYIVESPLGKGSFGCVDDLCKDKRSERQFVRKRVKQQVFRSSEVIVPLIYDHVNLMKVFGLIQRKVDRGYMLELLLEFAGQSLFGWVQDRDVSEDQIWDVMKQGLSGLAQLDRYSIVHLHIKPENLCIQILPDGKLQIKITDFGSAKFRSEELNFIGITPEYLPAEMCKLFLQQKYSNFGLDKSAVTGKVDVFALALTVMFMYKKYHILQKQITKGETSYDKYDEQTRQTMQHKFMIMMVLDEELVKNLIPEEVSLDMRDLLSRMVMYEYTERDSPEQALKFVEGNVYPRGPERTFNVHGQGYQRPRQIRDEHLDETCLDEEEPTQLQTSYEVVEGGTKRGGRMLISSQGYNFNVKQNRNE